jgi:tRNA (Thr-GGU) A37 N-methylase
LARVDGGTLVVKGLDCLDGTPLLDVKAHYALS